jgi:lipooligosaccharide transport system permease protein
MSRLILDLTTFPKWGWGITHVLRRNLKYLSYTFWITLFWIVFEPTLYLLAIGKGVGYFVGEIRGQSYLEFFFPALLCMTGMVISFFEATYASYARMSQQYTFKIFMLTPLRPDEVSLGEIGWATLKGFLGVLGVVAVSALLGLVNSWWLAPVLAVVLLMSWVSAAFGLLLTSSVRHWDYFIYAQSGILIPMTLFSGTYFPLDELPLSLARLAYIFPLTHAVKASRYFLQGNLNPEILVNLGILVVLGTFCTNWAVQRVRRKLLD